MKGWKRKRGIDKKKIEKWSDEDRKGGERGQRGTDGRIRR